MSKQYVIRFGTDDPGPHFGLNPTFISFMNIVAGTSALPPGISACIGSTGLYYFTYGPTVAMSFIVDGATTGLAGNDRYVTGLLDPIQAVDEQVNGIGSTLGFMYNQGVTILGFAGAVFNQGTSMAAIIGQTSSSFGSTLVDPSTVFGMLNRLQEFNEGDSTFNKSSGQWEISSRGASTLLRVKVLQNSTSTVEKT